MNKNLKYSIKDGIASSVIEGSGDRYIAPFAIAMNASANQIGLLSSLPNLIAPFLQLHAANLLKKYNRKRIVLISILIQALMWLPIAFIPFLFEKNNMGVWFIILFYVICFSAGKFYIPVWNSWMKDLVPKEKIGRFFGKRNAIYTFVLLTVVILASLFLDFFNNVEIVLICFGILFLIAMISGIVDMYILYKQHEPKFEYDSKSYFSLYDFVKRMKDSNFGRFVLYLSLFSLSVNMAGPFFAMYMLNELKFSYMTYMMMTVAASLAIIIFMPVWGRIADKYGTIIVLKACGIIVGAFPILFLFSKNAAFLFLVNAFSGFGWAGFNLCAANFVYDVAKREKIALCVTYQNIFSGVGIFLGATIGGLLVTMPRFRLLGSVFLFIFLISAIARLLLTYIFWDKFKEVRKVEEKPVLEIMGASLMSSMDVFASVNNKLHEKLIKRIKRA